MVEGFSLFDPKFLEEISRMKEKNLAVELLRKLIAEQVAMYRRTNVVKSEKFSEIIAEAMRRYLNGMLTNEEVIAEVIDEKGVEDLKIKIVNIQEELAKMLESTKGAMEGGVSAEKLQQINNIVLELEKASVNLGSSITAEDRDQTPLSEQNK